MKKLKLIILSAFIIAIPFINGCKVTYPNEKYLNGKWVPVKVEKYIEPGKVASEQANKQQSQQPVVKSDTNVQKDKAKNSGTVQSRTPEQNLSRMIEVEQRTVLEIFPENKTVVKDYHGKVVKATWKMKKKGTRIIAKENTTGKKLTLDILEINDTSVVVIEHSPVGKIKIHYRKEFN
jgi:hypothetical protein